MRILFVTNDPPDPDRNPAERWTYVLLRELCARGHHISVWAVAGEVEHLERSRRALGPLHLELHLCRGASRRSSVAGKFRTLREPFTASIPDEMREGVRRQYESGAFDVLHVEHLQGYGHQAAGLPHALVSVHMLNLLDLRGSGLRSWEFTKNKLLYYSSELRLLRRFRHVRVLTPQLAEVVRRINPRADVWTIPIALDPASYPVFPNHRSSGRTVGLIAGMRWEHSRRAAERLVTAIWPRVRRRMPDARLLIAGWGAAEVLAAHLNEPGIEICQDVADVTDFFRGLMVLAYPLPFGGGLKGKVLEAMAYGVPVVTTSAGISGIAATPGVHAFVEDDNEMFAESVVELLGNVGLRRRMADAARALVEERYSPGPVVSQFEALYRAIGSAPAGHRLAVEACE